MGHFQAFIRDCSIVIKRLTLAMWSSTFMEHLPNCMPGATRTRVVHVMFDKKISFLNDTLSTWGDNIICKKNLIYYLEVREIKLIFLNQPFGILMLVIVLCQWQWSPRSSGKLYVKPYKSLWWSILKHPKKWFPIVIYFFIDVLAFYLLDTKSNRVAIQL